MEEILALAKQLGTAIAGHETCTAFRTAAEALGTDAEASRLQQEYSTVAQEMHEKTAAGEALEPELKRKEQDLREQVAVHPTIRSFLLAQGEFEKMMTAINQAVEGAIGAN